VNCVPPKQRDLEITSSAMLSPIARDQHTLKPLSSVVELCEMPKGRMAAFLPGGGSKPYRYRARVGFEGVLRALQWVILGSGEVSQL
jgi:hypothetical protein